MAGTERLVGMLDERASYTHSEHGSSANRAAGIPVGEADFPPSWPPSHSMAKAGGRERI
jgi:hypothetical protein